MGRGILRVAGGVKGGEPSFFIPLTLAPNSTSNGAWIYGGVIMELGALQALVGAENVLVGPDTGKWASDWTGGYCGTPLAVVRPANTAQVSAVVAWANSNGIAVVPMSGATGLVGGGLATDQIVLSLDRMNRIRDLRPDARIAIVEAGVILSTLHAATANHGLIFPMTFGARGSAMIGGMLATNAGGSNVLRYGNMRDLCLGLEVVLADGTILDLMSELHKDNSGYDLRHLLIGSEGTLGIITAAVLKLAEQPKATATALVALPDLGTALDLLNRMQTETGGAVQAFEFMPRAHFEGYYRLHPEARPVLEDIYDVHILIETGATAPRQATPRPDGTIPVVEQLETILAEMLESGDLLDAVVAQSDTQRAQIWSIREAAAEITFSRRPYVDNDIALPLDKVETFLTRIGARIARLDPDANDLSVAHLGDGNIHYTIYPTRDDPALKDALRETVEDLVQELRGSFSAEHGIGKSKLATMRRRKDPATLATMRAIKSALDPKGTLNPGKVLPV